MYLYTVYLPYGALLDPTCIYIRIHIQYLPHQQIGKKISGFLLVSTSFSVSGNQKLGNQETSIISIVPNPPLQIHVHDDRQNNLQRKIDICPMLRDE